MPLHRGPVLGCALQLFFPTLQKSLLGLWSQLHRVLSVYLPASLTCVCLGVSSKMGLTQYLPHGVALMMQWDGAPYTRNVVPAYGSLTTPVITILSSSFSPVGVHPAQWLAMLNQQPAVHPAHPSPC